MNTGFQTKKQADAPVIEIDPNSGFCFGVVTAINKAESELAKGQPIFCLGDIVHNNAEVERLRQKGLHTIDHSALSQISDATVMLRAHGEPPATYSLAQTRGLTIIDATCPVVLKLQQRIKRQYTEIKQDSSNGQIVIYGRMGHAEVNGLVGQTEGTAIVIESTDQLDKIDFERPVYLYSQTTKSLEGFKVIIDEIKLRMTPGVKFEFHDTICRQVANRVDRLRKFAYSHDLVLFVAGEKSSNGKVLFSHCLQVNPNCHLVPHASTVEADWIRNCKKIGICGATSTPRWQMEEVAEKVRSML